MATPMPMRDQSGMMLPARYDASGKPYYDLDNGGKQYIAPNITRQLVRNDPTLAANPNLQRLASDQTSAGGEGGLEWDPNTGQWHDTSNALLKATMLGAGGVIAAPFIAGALGAGGASGASGAAAGGGSGTAAATGGTTAATGTATGGLSMFSLQNILSRLPGLSSVLGGASSAAQKSNQSRDALSAQLANTQLGRDKFALDAPGTRLKTALQAALAKSATPASVSWGGPGSGLKGQVPTFSGGSSSIYQALQDPNVKALSDRMTQDELSQQMTGGATGGNKDEAMGLPSNFGKSSFLDKLLGGGALGGSLLSSILPALQKGNGGGFSEDTEGAQY